MTDKSIFSDSVVVLIIVGIMAYIILKLFNQMDNRFQTMERRFDNMLNVLLQQKPTPIQHVQPVQQQNVVPLFKKIDSRFNNIDQKINVLNQSMNQRTKLIENSQKQLMSQNVKAQAVKKPYSKLIDENFTIAVDSSWTSQSISNPGYNSARLKINVGFTPSNISGLAVYLFYMGANVQNIMQVQEQDRGIIQASNMFSVQGIDGFNIVIVNTDTSNSIKINKLSIEMY